MERFEWNDSFRTLGVTDRPNRGRERMKQRTDFELAFAP